MTEDDYETLRSLRMLFTFSMLENRDHMAYVIWEEMTKHSKVWHKYIDLIGEQQALRELEALYQLKWKRGFG